MMRYEYRCRDCGETVHADTPQDALAEPCYCGGRLKRVFGFTPLRVSAFKERWSHALGRPVSTQRELAAGLRDASEQQEAATGIPCRYVPIDPADHRSFVSDQSADQLAREARGRGETESKFISTPA